MNAMGMLVSTDGDRLVPIPDGRLDRIGSGDIRRRRLSGKPQSGQEFHGNFVECRLDDIEFERINLSRCDLKDCRVEKATFIDCDLGHASWMTNWFRDCRFIRCKFSDTGIGDCEFRSCTFDECDLTNIVVKSSHIEETAFKRCKTSNRIIESSLLIDSSWVETDVEAALIIGNFGLRQVELNQCRLVAKATSGERHSIPWGELERFAIAQPLSAIERFRLRYFTTGRADADADVLEAALDLRNWRDESLVQASFGALLSALSQFLLILYNADRIPAYPLLLLHTNNFELFDHLSSRPVAPSLIQIIAGVHLTLTREVDRIVALLQQAMNTFSHQNIVRFGAEGPVDRSYFERFFEELGLNGTKILSVKPRNSPVDLEIGFSTYSMAMACVALFLACRTRLELSRLPPELLVGPSSEQASSSREGNAQQLIVFHSGFSSAQPTEYEVNLRTLLPRSLLLDLKLNISVATFSKARAILIEILKKDPPEDSR